ncbi:Holliday junction resolvase RuvX [Kineococcus radiotolerans]|uniref:Putative pre-16S rRNA nuclease n=1 Tax=Kineococcus radiotolerans (strain ATCC BAA-149 / DSM 14245 / SRS30216) TaxID=266940 RepID=YQGF_KINRD|nr:Holliday junction resolvase RuvX [Kineococcus radiotolerans]A6WCF6.1 RecName: Full=Putative pre-16S rRNA nuclease [Kineococcus radiotolerans SRS30216 = ATCC BAA-149]ABS04495.1 Holliday junction resolvase YqgF [Kineococcus radiotolerans SRS30216 = ATCC BAA-149]
MRPGVRLAVDVGSVRVGLAACDPAGVIASPVRTLVRDPGHDADVAEIAAEARARGAVEIVLGLPLSLDGSEGPAALRALDYADKIVRSVPEVPVRLVDERLSTVGAHRALHAAGLKEKQFRAVVDQAAAVVLLQATLDAERTGHAPGRVVAGPKGRRKARHRGQGGTGTEQQADAGGRARPHATEGKG